MQKPSLTDRQKREVAASYSDGISGYDLATQYGVGKMVIYRALRQAGVFVHRSRIFLAMDTKKCSRCHEDKTLDHFHKTSIKQRQPGISVRRNVCKLCANKQNRDRGYSRRFNTGLTRYQYWQLLIQQSGRCAICFDAATDCDPLQVDHDHSNEEIRGLLCRTCNMRMILVDGGRDVAVSHEWMMSALRYQRESRTGLVFVKSIKKAAM